MDEKIISLGMAITLMQECSAVDTTPKEITRCACYILGYDEYSFENEIEERNRLNNNEALELFRVTDVAGDFLAKHPIMLEIRNKWMGFCKQELPSIRELGQAAVHQAVSDWVIKAEEQLPISWQKAGGVPVSYGAAFTEQAWQLIEQKYPVALVTKHGTDLQRKLTPG